MTGALPRPDRWRNNVLRNLCFAMSAVSAVAVATIALAAPHAPAGDPGHGKVVFACCAACHSVASGGASGFGPNLAGVVGRPAGSLPGYAYSAAMKASRLKLDEATISRFLSGPSVLVPGTKMTAPPLTDPQERADVIAYLKTTSSGGKK